jgi:molybdopterin converting factor small subunit
MADELSVRLHLPGALAGYAGGRREIEVLLAAPPGLAGDTAQERGRDGERRGPGDATVAGVLDRLAVDLPALERRIRDENSSIRRHVNVYVDGADIRTLAGADTPVENGAVIDVIAAISGG